MEVRAGLEVQAAFPALAARLRMTIIRNAFLVLAARLKGPVRLSRLKVLLVQPAYLLRAQADLKGAVRAPSPPARGLSRSTARIASTSFASRMDTTRIKLTSSSLGSIGGAAA